VVCLLSLTQKEKPMIYKLILKTKATLLFALFLVGLISLKPFTTTQSSSSYVTSQTQITTYDLAADWSNTSNPNGAWSYNEGLNPLPLTPFWYGGQQPGWAYCCNYPGGFGHVPVWLKWQSTQGLDFQAGDVSVHSSDSGRGENFGPANVTWTSPSAGVITISGSAWISRTTDRSNRWTLYLNGNSLSSGQMFGGGPYNRSNQFNFSAGSGGAAAIVNIPVSAGDVVKLEVTKLSTYGDFVGVNLRIIFEPASQTCVQPPLGLVSWWPLDETAGLIAADIIGGNDGTHVSGPTPVAGHVAGALNFDGINDFVNIPSAIIDVRQPYTLDAWIFLRTDRGGVMGNVQVILNKDARLVGGSVDLGFFITNRHGITRRLGVHHVGATVEGVFSSGQIPLNQWTHVAVTYDGIGTNRFYINGQLDTTASQSDGTNGATAWEIGGGDPAGEFFDGLIDEVEIFNRALSASEIQTIYNAGNAGKCKPDAADLAITKVFASPSVLTGSTLTSMITVTNNGPAMTTSITVTDNLPTSTTFLSCSATSGGICSGSGNNRTVTFASLAAGSSATITIEAIVNCSVTDGAEIVNTATVSSSLPDSDMSNNSMTATATALNPPPVITCPVNVSSAGNVPGSCSATVSLGTATATDNCPGVTVVGVRSDGQPLIAPYPLGVTPITWTATDSGGRSASCQQSVTVTNPSPTVTITGPQSGAVHAVGTPVNFTGSFTDNPGGAHTANWMFDAINQAGTVNETTGAVSATYTFTSAGVYMVKLTVNDGCGGTGMADTVDGLTAMVVIYDPNGGFVTGGGWINSPAGAYPDNPSLTGKANFGFVSKYQQGATVPTGQTEFQFKVAGLNFHSSVYEWLVVAGARAQYKGVGKINGAGNYGFLLTAIDGQINGGGGVDKFRIKIWDKNNNDVIVYDNKLGSSDNSNDSTELGGGSIVIHK
jgi:uncharacterized repeat protein (TIGR01451 family)